MEQDELKSVLLKVLHRSIACSSEYLFWWDYGRCVVPYLYICLLYCRFSRHSSESCLPLV